MYEILVILGGIFHDFGWIFCYPDLGGRNETDPDLKHCR